MAWKASEKEYKQFEEKRNKESQTTSKGTGGQKITTYYTKPEPVARHERIRAERRETRETQKDRSTPLGWFETKILGATPVTTAGRRKVEKTREYIGEKSEVVKKKVTPVIRAAQPFVADFSTMMRAPMINQPVYDSKGKQKGTRRVRGPQPSPLSGMAMPPIGWQLPNYFASQPPQRKGKKGKRSKEDHDDGGIWGNMMDIPEHAKRWM